MQDKIITFLQITTYVIAIALIIRYHFILDKEVKELNDIINNAKIDKEQEKQEEQEYLEYRKQVAELLSKLHQDCSNKTIDKWTIFTIHELSVILDIPFKDNSSKEN